MGAVDINCDFGEDFGIYKIKDYSELLQYVDSVNIACGFHASDPSNMRKAVEASIEYGVNVGAHPGYPDIVGFGRRNMEFTKDEIYDIVLYQIGALDAFLKKFGKRLHHVKPHGALYNRAAVCEKTSEAIADAVRDYSNELILYALANSVTVQVAQKKGLTVWSEAFVDRTYEQDGQLTPRKIVNSVISDPHFAAAQFQQIVNESTVTTRQQTTYSIAADTFCIHGDNDAAVEILRSIRKEHRSLR
ncbi:5-oxoprolinase subunit PxpA [Sporosarcina contaminans]|uniref:5-oxoprolinase subunit PxpA n=1 Tax=Sporosarcina contaminans TaxID=633403 RepID=A0ABW3U1X3_9BACL